MTQPIPPDHDAATIFAARYISTGCAGKRAFSDSARARRWVEDQTAQDLPWEADGDEWVASTSQVSARVERIPLHDPLTLKRRYPDAFNGEYTDPDG